MNERHNTLVCAFYLQSLRITAYDTHEWTYDTLSLQENEVAMVQVDGPKRHVYIKFREDKRTQEIPMKPMDMGNSVIRMVKSGRRG